jgi:hypothetical protein
MAVSDANWNARKSERLRVTLRARCTTARVPQADTNAAVEDDPDYPARPEAKPTEATSGVDEDGVTLVNITPEGCCMLTGGAILVRGTAVLIRLDSGEGLTGVIRWCDGEKAGVEFDHYLPRERVDYFRREHSTFLSESDPNQHKVQRSVC